MDLIGHRMRLRPPTVADVTGLEEVFAEAAVQRWWGTFDADRIAHEFVEDDDPTTTISAIEVDGQVAGLIQCYEEPDDKYRHAGIDIALGTRWHGTGVAVDAIRTLVRHLIDRGHHHFTIDPAVDNRRAIACYAKVGFRPVGVLRRNERGEDGSFHDTLLMDLVAEELR